MSAYSRHKVFAGLMVMLASASASGQSIPPARALGSALATSEGFAAVSSVRILSTGEILVNDPATRRVVLLDTMLTVRKIVADSSPTTARAYGSRIAGLFAYRGDSTLFVDPGSSAMIVIDPTGQLGRVIAAPSRGDAGYLVGGVFPSAGVDARGGVIYRRISVGAIPRTNAQDTIFDRTGPDSTPLLRFDLGTRRLDTVAYLRVAPERFHDVRTKNSASSTRINDPIPIVDEFAVRADGRVVIMRGREYRLDLILEDGSQRRGEKIPYPWQRLSDEDKRLIIDSTRAVLEVRRSAAVGGASPATVAPIGGGNVMVSTTTTVDVQSGARTVTINPGASASAPPLFLFPPISELSDYRPAFATGALRADTHGRIWVRTIPTVPAPKGVIYDVIGTDGKRVDRVIVPSGTTIVGFGPNEIVLLAARDASGTHLIRLRER